jgi:hypothetical protein
MSISRRAAVRAATTLAADLGLREVEPRLLRDSSNVLLHLRPYPLVVRVATLTSLRPDQPSWLASDIELAGHPHDRGLPVVCPSTDPPAGPHDVGGITIALWRYLEHDPSAQVEPGLLVSMLGALHAAMRDFPGVHGDAHPGKVLVTPSGPVWNDFEDAWWGPVAWDYACVAVALLQLLARRFPARAGEARAALAEYAERHDQGYYDRAADRG